MTINLTGANWKTTIGGILAGLPPIIISSFTLYHVSLSPFVYALLSIVSGIGGLLTGLAAKDSTTHSTALQVNESTIKDAEDKGVPIPALIPPVVK